MFLSDRTIEYSQVHAHDPDVLFAFELKQIGLQGGFRAAESDVIDAMVLQIAEGGGVAFLAREEVFVDAQDPRANEGMILAGPALEAPQKVALDGSGSDALAST